MNLPLGGKRLWKKALSLLLISCFLSLTFSCAHGPAQNGTGRDRPDGEAAERTAPGAALRETPWWKKPEHEWLIATLIVIGVGIAVGAGIMISSGAGGLSIRVEK
jgi:hypothetical protein